ncbi:MAG: zinc ribbon domain-containing protein [Betaproteobacteria bacterium]|jgi:putative FmdB family regulatory protein|nr:zinc ribbon domain-containing protein [Betaproteobacteria bacterium]NBS45713.1 zinc ribbon domain-containing protein [Betaproteobacteria bacterium]
MPIYAYKCESCGHSKDVLQKISDAPLTECPACGKASFAKQLTAAGFQLKGSGWYVTDFRGGNNSGNSGGSASTGTASGGDAAKGEAPKTDGGSTESSGSSGKTEAATTAAAGCGGSCACH